MHCMPRSMHKTRRCMPGSEPRSQHADSVCAETFRTKLLSLCATVVEEHGIDAAAPLDLKAKVGGNKMQ
ncbi:hypothetical protein K438DRAFT_1833540 [Mycena galopus ATCC 62051]|nr:hypothetical protein K438DRAFT_1833540 [Mycena galopus ATCC 62051]